MVVPDCLDPELAQRWTDRAYERLGYAPDDPATWTEEIVWMDRHSTAPVREISPRGWGALCDVVGGEERIDPQVYEIESGHFTTIDSVPVVTRYLAQRPAGAGPGEFGSLVHGCREFVEVTGPCGTLVILHPFMLHASSNNHSGRPRFMSNPPIVLREPMALNRPDANSYSLLERATLHALGRDHCDFRPTVTRESYWKALGQPARR